MSVENKEKIIDKIIKLVNKSESAKKSGSIEEAELFAQKAQKMLQDYNLTRGDLTQKEAESEIIHEFISSNIPGVGYKHGANIMGVISTFNWCKTYSFGDTKMVIFGTPENIEVCKFIYSVVLNAFIVNGKKKYKEYVKTPSLYSPVGLYTYIRTFLVGATNGLREKLSLEREKMFNQNDNSTAIVRTNELAIKSCVESTFGTPSKGRKTRTSFAGNAYNEGKETGRNVQISKGIHQSKPIERKMLN